MVTDCFLVWWLSPWDEGAPFTMVTPAGWLLCIDTLLFTGVDVEGDFPWCAEAGSESVDWVVVAASLRCAGEMEFISRVFDMKAKCEVYEGEKEGRVARNVRLLLKKKK
jgi:hypothetical protein